ncbi:MAG: hypothetical protein AB7F40_07885 [Victivallaceae bacterium]|nr:hypothetical protein [Victivallaceae bacterium]
MDMWIFARRLAAAGVLILAAGCSSIFDAHSRKETFRNHYYQGNYPMAETELWQKVSSDHGSGDEVMWMLEAGSFYFLTGNTGRAAVCFDVADVLIEDFDRRAVVSARDAAGEVGSAFTNPAAVAYRGLYRDRVLLPVYAGFNCLAAGDDVNFSAYVNRMRDAMEQVQQVYAWDIEQEKKSSENYEKQNAETIKKSGMTEDTIRSKLDQSAEFKQSEEALAAAARPEYGNFLNPLAIFISGMMYWRDNQADNALIEFKRLYDAMPQDPLARKLYVTALRRNRAEVPPALANVKPYDFPVASDVVYVVFANGRCADYKQITVHMVLPTGYSGFAYPTCEYYPAPFPQLEVTAGGRSAKTEILADMDAVASNEYNARKTAMVTRIVISFLVKEATTAAAAIVAHETGNDWAAVGAIAAASVYKFAFNTADTRCWELLPKQYQLAILPMPADRKMTFTLPGVKLPQAVFPPGCRSAIVLVTAANAATTGVKVLPFSDK